MKRLQGRGEGWQEHGPPSATVKTTVLTRWIQTSVSILWPRSIHWKAQPPRISICAGRSLAKIQYALALAGVVGSLRRNCITSTNQYQQSTHSCGNHDWQTISDLLKANLAVYSTVHAHIQYSTSFMWYMASHFTPIIATSVAACFWLVA